MAKTKVVTSRESDAGKVWDFRCPYLSGCGADGVPFSSAGWSDRDHAVDRGKQHLAEHESGVPMPSLDEFRTEKGITAATAGQANLPDDWEF